MQIDVKKWLQLKMAESFAKMLASVKQLPRGYIKA